MYIDFAILEPLLQVVVDGLVGDLADQGEVGNANLLLLGALEDGLADLGLAAAGGLRGGGILLAPCALGNGLSLRCVSLPGLSVDWGGECKAEQGRAIAIP